MATGALVMCLNTPSLVPEVFEFLFLFVCLFVLCKLDNWSLHLSGHSFPNANNFISRSLPCGNDIPFLGFTNFIHYSVVTEETSVCWEQDHLLLLIETNGHTWFQAELRLEPRLLPWQHYDIYHFMYSLTHNYNYLDPFFPEISLIVWSDSVL